MRFYTTTALFLATLSLILESSHGGRCESEAQNVKNTFKDKLGVDVGTAMFEAYCNRKGRTPTAPRRTRPTVGGMENPEEEGKGLKKADALNMKGKTTSRRMQTSGKKGSGKKGGIINPVNPDFCPNWAPTPDRIARAVPIDASGKKGGASPGPVEEELLVVFDIDGFGIFTDFGFPIPLDPIEENFFTATTGPFEPPLSYFYESALSFDGERVGLLFVSCLIDNPISRDSGICTVSIQFVNPLPDPAIPPYGDLEYTGVVSATGRIFIATLIAPGLFFPLDAILPLAQGRGLCGLESVVAVEMDSVTETLALVFTPAINPIVLV
uniref:Uncharacterized protein n=1 Tax=Ditylum brightwellii TaxID=49249 RepID=A0A7S2EC40_9STRA|mmetsp:Transcript_23757/g.35454  ORF Transcript_23757/g.35454 Transcript_23757/m.35454 type:complete len:325 (+) Transcript_23757:43-1017(+)